MNKSVQDTGATKMNLILLSETFLIHLMNRIYTKYTIKQVEILSAQLQQDDI